MDWPRLRLGTARGHIGALMTLGTWWHRREGTRSHRGLREEEEEGGDPREWQIPEIRGPGG